MPRQMDWRQRISIDPEVCHGKACIRGTRVMVSVVLDNLGSGESPDAIAEAYHITPEDVHASRLYAAELTRENVLPLSGKAA